MQTSTRSSTSMVKEFTRQYLLLALFPVVLFFALAVAGGFIAQRHLSKLISDSTYELNLLAKKELEALGRQVIQDKARDAARQVGLFLSLKPEMDMEALQRSAPFQAIAMQPVGQNGYVCLYEAGTGIMRIHPNPALNNRKMDFLSTDIPSWWAIFNRSLSGKETSGYYDWIEPDGSVRKKYMAMTPVDAPFRGKTLMVAATTYIDTFSAPIAVMVQKEAEISANFNDFLVDQVLIAGFLTALVFLITFLSVYLIGRRSALRYMLPIVTMATAAENFGDGQWEADIEPSLINRKDEIGVLARSFDSMRHQLQKLFKDLEYRVSELKLAQQSLKESEAHFRGLFDGVPVGLYRTTFDGRIIDANPMLVRMLGYPSKAQFLSKKAEEIYAQPVDRSKWKTIIERSGVENVHEVKMRRYDQSVLWVENHSRTVRDQDGGILYVEGSLIDINERKKMENQLQLAQRMEAIGTLAGGLAHDFNNLMMGMLGNVSIMMLDTEINSPHYEKLKKVEQLIQSGSQLTSQLLGYARKGTFELKVLDLNKIVKDSVEIFGRTRKEIGIHMDLSSTEVSVEIDRSQVEQVLFNLLINSADAMPDGGDLWLQTSIVNRSEIGQKPYKMESGRYVLLQVTDTGHGMDAETQKRIFDPFFTTKEMGRGTGLGLASAYGIIKAHAGYIDVASEIGQGTTFSIYLPVSERRLPEGVKGDATIKFGKGTILVVDDEEMVLDIGTEMIGKMGYQTLSARNGDEAISVYRKSPDDIDLVVLDLIMPGASGSDTFDMLRQINTGVKVLLASGYSIDSQAIALMDRGCNGFIQKPYNLEDLSRKIDEILKS
ncbi:ATP-binding protein [Desulfosarcina sp.]|uniref:hybrid sensor histidine kinase/response regulator n=1 Tax=Desulfosarcina sp. TaxID=2027861 RepID=UPI003565C472